MARTQTMVQLSDSLVAALDAEAIRRGSSRSALIRELLADGLRRAGADTVGERIADGYRRIPQGHPDAWGDGLVVADVAGEELLQRLDAEERAAGHDPW
jgi:predicted transcriptional regulator